MAKINTGFKNYTDGDLSIKADFILSCMTGNANFTNPEPPLADVTAALEAFNTALADSKSRSKDLVLIKSIKRQALETLLTNLGLFVQLNSNDGDVVILSTSGFDLTKKRTPIGVLPKPSNFSARPGEAKGSIKLSMIAIDGANSYMYEYTLAADLPANTWLTIPYSRASVTINNLTSGSEYAFRAVGVGANPTKVYSEVISSYVL